MSNETAPVQKQDLDRVCRLLQKILEELRKETKPLTRRGTRGDSYTSSPPHRNDGSSVD